MVDQDEIQIDAGSIQGGSKKEHQREERPVTLLLTVEEKVSRALSKKVGLSVPDNKCTEQLESIPRAPATKGSLIMTPEGLTQRIVEDS